MPISSHICVGIILMHDCNPRQEEYQVHYQSDLVNMKCWLGDVWKAVVALRSDPSIDIVTGDFDMGMALIKIRKSSYPLVFNTYAAHSLINELTYRFLDENRRDLLLLHTFADVVKWLGPA